MFDLKRFRKENGRITQMAMAEMFNCTQGNIYAIEASGRDLTDEQLNILKADTGMGRIGFALRTDFLK